MGQAQCAKQPRVLTMVNTEPQLQLHGLPGDLPSHGSNTPVAPNELSILSVTKPHRCTASPRHAGPGPLLRLRIRVTSDVAVHLASLAEEGRQSRAIRHQSCTILARERLRRQSCHLGHALKDATAKSLNTRYDAHRLSHRLP